MPGRSCLYCRQTFEPSKYQPAQTVCGDAKCQKRRRSDYHRRRIAGDAEYRLACLESPRKWRERNPDYWKQYRAKNPAAVENNRQQQKRRDEKRRLRHLANNNSVLDLKHSATKVWLVGSGVEHLANNNSALSQVLVFEAIAHHWAPATPSCKQQPSGETAGSAP
jgi:hypothetical protein